MSDEQDINYSIVSKNTEKFSKIETMLYDKFPKYIESENYFFIGENSKPFFDIVIDYSYSILYNHL